MQVFHTKSQRDFFFNGAGVIIIIIIIIIWKSNIEKKYCTWNYDNTGRWPKLFSKRRWQKEINR